MVQGPVASGSPFWDAALTALLGIGFGEHIFQTARAHMFSEPRSGTSLRIVALWQAFWVHHAHNDRAQQASNL